MEILRVPSSSIIYPVTGLDAGVDYDYSILDLADHSVSTGVVSITSSGQTAYIELPSTIDGEYEITVDEFTEIVSVVRPYVDPTTKGDTATEIAEYRKNEEIARAIIDSIVNDGFYYTKKYYSTTGLGADYLPIWTNANKLLKLYENNVLVFDISEPELYTVQYGLTKDKFAIKELYLDTFNRNESAPILLPAAGSDVLELNFAYRGFPRGFDYSAVLEVGYKKIPSDVVRATEMLVDDISCGKLDYYKRYIADYNTDQFKIKFDSGVFEGTGNIIVDKILSKYMRPIRTIGVL
jgi:hypothetical protein